MQISYLQHFFLCRGSCVDQVSLWSQHSTTISFFNSFFIRSSTYT